MLNKSIKKGGTLLFVCWTDYQYNDFFSIPVNVLSSVTGLKKNRLTRNPGPFAFNNKNYIYKILQNSNFKKIKIKTIKTKLIAENITKDLNIFMKIGIAAKMMRENNINKIIKKKIKLKLKNYLIRNIYNNAGSYKAKVFLVKAFK